MVTLFNLLVIRISVGIVEIIIFQIGAIVLGFALQMFLTSRKNTRLQLSQGEDSVAMREADEWKLKYFNDTEDLEKRMQKLQHELKLSRDNEQFLAIEIDSVRQEREELLESHAELSSPARQTTEYLQELQDAQQHMMQHNSRMQQLLTQIEQLKTMEQKQQELLHANDLLAKQMADMRVQLVEKENDIRALRQQNRLGEEMQQRLEKVYADYNGLLEKMHKLEAHVSHSQKEGTSYAEMQDAYFKMTKDQDELKMKYLNLLEDSQRTTRTLADVEDKLREANFQRMQLQKKSAYLEELNMDLQQVAEHHNKLHSQMRRITEIEQLLAKATQFSSSPDKDDSSI
jgi:DNA repair exonuclease SbcCD ATPase subunit